ncbi:hypothetical protein K474DRAFT_1601735 [Panus rudis PR-1116 ss-1]|nr:hypothetical protein K474DRAFT_1601735 [Panus rudis PR-1116 ss-1]
MAVSETYCNELRSLKYGLPVWLPDCDDGIRIGDVGYFSEGHWIRLFNATLPANDPLNANGVPLHYVPLKVDPKHHRQADGYIRAGVICSSSVKGISIGGQASVDGGIVELKVRYECTENKGAMLVLHRDADHDSDLPNRRFASYIAAHHRSWVKFAEETLELVLPSPESVILV